MAATSASKETTSPVSVVHGLGLFGVISEITLNAVPMFHLRKREDRFPVDDVISLMETLPTTGIERFRFVISSALDTVSRGLVDREMPDSRRTLCFLLQVLLTTQQVTTDPIDPPGKCANVVRECVSSIILIILLG